MGITIYPVSIVYMNKNAVVCIVYLNVDKSDRATCIQMQISQGDKINK